MIPAWHKPLSAALFLLLALVLTLHGPEHEGEDASEGAECVLCQVSMDGFEDPEPSVAPAWGTGRVLAATPEEFVATVELAPHAARGPPAARA